MAHKVEFARATNTSPVGVGPRPNACQKSAVQIISPGARKLSTPTRAGLDQEAGGPLSKYRTRIPLTPSSTSQTTNQRFNPMAHLVYANGPHPVSAQIDINSRDTGSVFSSTLVPLLLSRLK